MRKGKSNVVEILLAWFKKNGRTKLPWRNSTDPWLVMASEIMLQQTQVDRVIPKYLEFAERWPAPSTLAQTSQREFLAFWSGLGYNRRALNLHRAATQIAAQYHDELPHEHAALLALPGIGRYTAGAIMSFAWNADVVLWDTNVRRIVLRVFHGGEFAEELITEKQLELLLAQLLPSGKSREWHGALMDLGAAVCTSRKPKCGACPLVKNCLAAVSFEKGYEPLRKLIRPQATFIGSFRQLRGAVVRHLAQSGVQDESRLAEMFADPRFNQALAALEHEGFIRRHKGVVSCA